MVFNLRLVHSTRSLELFTHQETRTNPRTFGIESITSIRLLCQSLFLNSESIGSTGYFRIPRDLLPKTAQPVALGIKIHPSPSIQRPPVRSETHFKKQTANGHLSVTLHFIKACHPVTPSLSLSRMTALSMSCSPSILNLILDSQTLWASVGDLRANLTETNLQAPSQIQ